MKEKVDQFTIRTQRMQMVAGANRIDNRQSHAKDSLSHPRLSRQQFLTPFAWIFNVSE